jgi:hypothetical protein
MKSSPTAAASIPGSTLHGAHAFDVSSFRVGIDDACFLRKVPERSGLGTLSGC